METISKLAFCEWHFECMNMDIYTKLTHDDLAIYLKIKKNNKITLIELTSRYQFKQLADWENYLFEFNRRDRAILDVVECLANKYLDNKKEVNENETQ